MVDENKLVFVVDDDKPVRDSLKFALELDGLRIKVCGSGLELLTDPALGDARCLVIDYRMPAMDAFDLLEELDARHMKIPVILITSADERALRTRARAAGVTKVLEKPLLGATLFDAISGVLNAGRADETSNLRMN